MRDNLQQDAVKPNQTLDLPPAYSISVASDTRTGNYRDINEDSVWVRCEQNAALGIVADGMGGHSHGEYASTQAVRFFADAFQRSLLLAPLAFQEVANEVDRLIELSKTGGGTTCCVVSLLDGKLTVANIGDSRAYLLRGTSMRRLTHDDSLVQALIDSQEITESEAATHPKRNLLLKALGSGKQDLLTISECAFMQGDLIMICSDGIHGFLDDNEIQRNLLAESNTEGKCSQLIDEALLRGSNDNVSVVVLESLIRDRLFSDINE